MKNYKMTPFELYVTFSLGAVFSLRQLGIFMVLPVMTTYGMTLQGANEVLVGLAIGIYGLMQAVFQIPCGLLSDRIGYRQVIIGGLLLFILGSVIASLSYSIWGVIFGRALQGSGTITPPIMALLSDLIREQNRTKAISFIGISFGINFIISMVLGPLVANLFGLHSLFWLIVILSVISMTIMIWVVPDSKSYILNREIRMVKGCFSRVLRKLSLLKLNFGIMCLHILLMFIFVALPRQMRAVGISITEYWKICLIIMIISFILGVPFVIYAEVKHRIKHIFLLCIILLQVAEIMFAGGLHFWGMIIGIQLFFFAFNIMEVLLPSLISKESPAGHKGTAMGIYSTSQFIGVAIGGMLGGWLSGFFGLQAIFLVSIFLLTIWLLVASSMKEPPYITSLRIEIPNGVEINEELKDRLAAKAGVSEVLIVAEERSIYIKINKKIINRLEIESTLNL